MKLRWRFTLTLALAALVPISVAAVVTRQVIAQAAHDEYRELRESSEQAMREALERHVKQVEGVVRSLASASHPYVAAMALDKRKPGRQGSMLGEKLALYRQQGRPWMEGLALDVLLVVEHHARKELVVVSPHLRSAESEDDDVAVRAMARLTRGAGYYTRMQLPVTDRRAPDGRDTEPVLVTVAARLAKEDEVETDDTLGVLAGRRVTRDLLGTVYREGRVDARVVATDGSVLIPPRASDWAQLADDSPSVIDLRGPDGKPFARVEVAVSRGDLDAALRKLTYTSAGLALAALGAVVLIGLLVARRTARDLDALVEGSLAASRGDLDHRVPVRSKDEVGAVAHAFNFMMEDLKVSKERLVIAERIAAWQEIARRLAHEIKNPLTPIQMAMDTLRKTHKKKHPSFDEILEESTSTVLEEADRLKRLVAEFSDFARMPKPEFGRLDLDEVVRSAVSLYQGAVPVEVRLGGLPLIDADKGQLNQVVLNLVENARDAIAGRPNGQIMVSTRLGDAGDRALLVVEDNGPGVPPDLKDKVFAPYFTTKHARGGTGLGLAIVHRIVNDHGGRIALSDAPGGGARFTIELPLRNGTALLVSRI
jgi:two-component system, NtrC family, nitrogen regulation sensor histidine kinase NtrY